ncbi:MAG: hypothetical protein M1825_003373 [Sarcosagium campestre]|nr:MAG: hypothetical protein M1825_003373 [Sarcosagium campestre]
MAIFKKPLAGFGYIILNVIRVLNIITLLSVVVASWVMLVKTFIVSKFFFFDAISHVVASAIGLFLIVSEFQLFKSWYAKNWPLLSPSSGFVGLGSAMAVLGVTILGNLNKEATSQKSLGMAFWRIVTASGILAVIIGVMNIVASFIFCDKPNGVTARHVRSKGAVVVSQGAAPSRACSRKSSQNTFHSRNGSLPSYYQPNEEPSRKSSYPKLSISRPMNFNQQFREFIRSPLLQKPDDAHHPVHNFNDNKV